MRISSAYQYGVSKNRVGDAVERLADAQLKVSTGKRFTRMDQDPTGARVVLDARRLQSRLTQLDGNLSRAKGVLGFTDSTLGEMSQLVSRARTLAVQGASDTQTQTTRDAIAAEVASLQSRLLDQANARGPQGEYLFAGQKLDVKPFEASAGALVYHGDAGPREAEVRPGETMRLNLTGGDTLISDTYNALESLRRHLMSGSTGEISRDDLNALQGSLDRLGNARSEIGAKLQEVTTLKDQHQRRIDDLTERISDAEDVDLADAMMELASAETAYQAALQVTARGFNLSLMDFIR